MIIYSVTVTIDEDIERSWREYMLGEHIPDVMRTGYFSDFSFQKLLEPRPDEGQATYNIQYTCDNLERFRAYRDSAAPALQNEHNQKFKDRFVAFRTLLEKMK
jgi:hypothetical protein